MHQFLLFALALLMIAGIAVIGPPEEVHFEVDPRLPRHRPEVLALTLGVVADAPASEVYRRYAPVLAELNGRLGRELGREFDVGLRLAPSSEIAVRELLSGTVDLARLGPAETVRVLDHEPGVRPLALERWPTGLGGGAALVVRDDSEIRELDQLRGARIAFGDPLSGSGRYFAQALLVEHGLSAADLAAYAYLDRSQRVLRAVASGEFDAGAVEPAADPVGRGLRVLGDLPGPGCAWVPRVDLPAELAAGLGAALLGLEELEALGAVALEVPADEEFEGTRAAMDRAVGFERRR